MPPKEFNEKRLRDEKILKIIESEFDLELLLKYREMRILEHELERGKELKELLEKLILNEQIYNDKSSGRLSAPPQFNFSSSNIFDNAEGNSQSGEYEIYSSKGRNTLISRQNQILSNSKPVASSQQYQFDIKPDGTVLRMRCPTCGAEKFRSLLGFLNHCRIHCKLTFANQEDRLQKCGVPVPPDEIPIEFQNLSHSLIQKSMELAQICVDVQPTKVVEDLAPEIKVVDEPLELIGFGINSTTSQVSLSLPVNNEELSPSNVNPRSNFFQIKKNVSRYYIKREIIVGNVSRCLLSSGEVDDSVGGRPDTHYFKLFIRDVNFRKINSSNAIDPGDKGVLRHVKFVRFFLHPAYKPNDIIDVYEQPFTIERPAWGEFPIRIQLHFFDAKNKPIDLVHLLSIFSSTSSRYDQGVERLHEIEIDKNTDFNLSSSTYQQTRFTSEVLDSDSDHSESEPLSSNEIANNSSTLVKKFDGNELDLSSLKYCRYCGIPHMPQHSFEIIQKNCAQKPRKIRLNSRTLPSRLFLSNNISVQDFQPTAKSHVSLEEVPIEDEIFVDDESSESVKMVAACAKLLNLPHFIPSERTCTAIFAATKCFLKHLLAVSVEQIPPPVSRAALDQKSPAALSPLHIFQAITNEPFKTPANSDESQLNVFNVFDFLSNSYFSASMGPTKTS